MRSLLRTVCLVAALSFSVVVPSTVQACPMCKIAHEDSTDPAVAARPRAYFYSIMFMLAMPTALLTTFGVTFYRLSRQQQEINAQLMAE